MTSLSLTLERERVPEDASVDLTEVGTIATADTAITYRARNSELVHFVEKWIDEELFDRSWLAILRKHPEYRVETDGLRGKLAHNYALNCRVGPTSQWKIPSDNKIEESVSGKSPLTTVEGAVSGQATLLSTILLPTMSGDLWLRDIQSGATLGSVRNWRSMVLSSTALSSGEDKQTFLRPAKMNAELASPVSVAATYASPPPRKKNAVWVHEGRVVLSCLDSEVIEPTAEELAAAKKAAGGKKNDTAAATTATASAPPPKQFQVRLAVVDIWRRDGEVQVMKVVDGVLDRTVVKEEQATLLLEDSPFRNRFESFLTQGLHCELSRGTDGRMLSIVLNAPYFSQLASIDPNSPGETPSTTGLSWCAIFKLTAPCLAPQSNDDTSHSQTLLSAPTLLAFWLNESPVSADCLSPIRQLIFLEDSRGEWSAEAKVMTGLENSEELLSKDAASEKEFEEMLRQVTVGVVLSELRVLSFLRFLAKPSPDPSAASTGKGAKPTPAAAKGGKGGKTTNATDLLPPSYECTHLAHEVDRWHLIDAITCVSIFSVDASVVPTKSEALLQAVNGPTIPTPSKLLGGSRRWQSLMAIGHSNGMVTLWNLETRQSLCAVAKHPVAVTGVVGGFDVETGRAVIVSGALDGSLALSSNVAPRETYANDSVLKEWYLTSFAKMTSVAVRRDLLRDPIASLKLCSCPSSFVFTSKGPAVPETSLLSKPSGNQRIWLVISQHVSGMIAIYDIWAMLSRQVLLQETSVETLQKLELSPDNALSLLGSLQDTERIACEAVESVFLAPRNLIQAPYDPPLPPVEPPILPSVAAATAALPKKGAKKAAEPPPPSAEEEAWLVEELARRVAERDAEEQRRRTVSPITLTISDSERILRTGADLRSCCVVSYLTPTVTSSPTKEVEPTLNLSVCRGADSSEPSCLAQSTPYGISTFSIVTILLQSLKRMRESATVPEWISPTLAPLPRLSEEPSISNSGNTMTKTRRSRGFPLRGSLKAPTTSLTESVEGTSLSGNSSSPRLHTDTLSSLLLHANDSSHSLINGGPSTAARLGSTSCLAPPSSHVRTLSAADQLVIDRMNRLGGTTRVPHTNSTLKRLDALLATL